jgi:hypothetical protein
VIRIKDWHKFQHFKERRPPWIKLYRDLLDDDEWFELDPLSSKFLVMFWLIASEDNGQLPTVKKLAFRLHTTEKQIESIVSKLSHWMIRDDITAISPRYQLDPSETETETEKETEKRHKNTVFVPPSYEEVETYCKERNSPIDPIAFHSHYATNGWRVGKAGLPMKSWQAAIVTWERRMK